MSANFLYGGRLFLTKAELDFLQLFQLGEPVTDIGHSILVFKVRQDDPHIHNNVGLVLARRGHLHAAAELFRRALVIQPEFAEAHQNLARVLRLQGNRSEAIYHYEEALRIMKTRPQALVTP